MERPEGPLRLKRSLTLWNLILYGVIVIQPTAPLPIFGILSERARGHVVVTILIAMVGMLFTAISYGRMARVYPSAGCPSRKCYPRFKFLHLEVRPRVLCRCLLILFWPPYSVCYGRLLGILSTTPQFASAPARTGDGKSGSAPTTAGPAPFDESTSASSPRSLVLDRLVAFVARLALHPCHR